MSNEGVSTQTRCGSVSRSEEIWKVCTLLATIKNVGVEVLLGTTLIERCINGVLKIERKAELINLRLISDLLQAQIWVELIGLLSLKLNKK